MAAKAERLGTGRTGGRDATTGVIPGCYALSVGNPETETPDGWKWTPLSEVAQLESGHTPSRKHSEYWDGDVPWIGIKDATENHGRTIFDTYQHVTPLGLANSSARLLPANTVCLSRTASVGFVVVMGRPMATSQDFVNWVCGPNLDAHFLKYVLLAEKEALLRFSSGTTHQTIYYPEAKAFHVCLPPLQEQKSIASILGALDDKIELNRRMNATLEAMARALFQSWFVDFDPVHAKLDGRRPKGLDTETAELFPKGFEKTDGGVIPKGWKCSHLREIAEVLSGGTPKKDVDSFWNGCFPWISPKAMMHIHVDDSDEHVSEAAIGNGTRLVPRGSVLVMVRGMGLHQGVRISQAQADVTFNQDVKAIVAKGIPNVFLFFALLHAAPSLLSKVHASGHGTGVLSTEFLDRLELAVPPDNVCKQLSRHLEILNSQIAVNDKQSRNLAALRDTLIPKLLVGELVVHKSFT